MPDTVWDHESLRDPHSRADKARRVEAMFDAIAPTYERVNTAATFGMDAGWRERTVADAEVKTTDIVLDLCCGTGDMIRTFANARTTPQLILGVDFSAGMLGCGAYEESGPAIQLIRADAQRLPLRSQTVDIVSCAFGVRNFQDLDAGLREIRRVLRPAGRAVILEFAMPENVLIRAGYRLYTEIVLPRLGTWISRDRTGAYRYLPRSIAGFERRGAMIRRMTQAGFASVSSRAMNMGSVVIYKGVVA